MLSFWGTFTPVLVLACFVLDLEAKIGQTNGKARQILRPIIRTTAKTLPNAITNVGPYFLY